MYMYYAIAIVLKLAVYLNCDVQTLDVYYCDIFLLQRSMDLYYNNI